MNPLFANIPTTIFEVMSGLARDTGAINLGQGFPDDPGPEDVRRKAADAVLNGYNQYPSMMGLPELRSAIAAHYAHWQGLDLDAEHRGHGDVGRDRSPRRRDPGRWSSPATRWCCSSRCTTPICRWCGWRAESRVS